MTDSDRNEEFVIEDLLPIAIAYCDSEPFQSAIDAFTSKYAECFATAAEGKSNEVMEISHEHHALFTQYQELVDDLFVGLADKNGFTLKALYRCFRDAGGLCDLSLLLQRPESNNCDKLIYNSRRKVYGAVRRARAQVVRGQSA
jgi:hypothetical protein